MTRLATAFRENVSKELFELYYEFLGNVETDKLKECIDTLIEEKKWFPKIAEFEEILNPKKSHESEYMAYLERSTERQLSEIKQLEIKNKQVTKEEAMKWLGKIKETIEPDLYKPTLEGKKSRGV